MTPLTPNALAELRPSRKAHLERHLTGFRGDARLYRCEPPLAGHDRVVVSAANVPFSGPETYIFPADAEGKVIDYTELHGSFQGALDHAEALRGAGYEIAETDAALDAARESGGG